VKRLATKAGVLALVLVLCMAALSVGFAMWSETLNINGTVETGNVAIQFSNCKSSDYEVDDPLTTTVNETLDPKVHGTWDWSANIDDPAYWIWSGGRFTVDMGKTLCSIGTDSATGNARGLLSISMSSGYPGYCSNVGFTIDNMGSVPVAIESIQLTHVSKGVNFPTGGIDLVAGETKYVHFIKDPFGTITGYEVHETLQPESEFSLTLSELAIGQTIDQKDGSDDARFGDICFRVEQGASRGASYDFTIEVVACQYNEYESAS